MLDKNLVRDNLEFVRERLSTRGGSFPIDELIQLDQDWKKLLLRAEELRRRRNEASEQIGRLKREGRDTAAEQSEVKQISSEIKTVEEQVGQTEERLNNLLHSIPNLPHASVPVGSDESANLEVRRWGRPPQFDFSPLDHVDLGAALGILDTERASKIAGARF